MPIPKVWSEELVCEWLCLKGYSTEVGIPLGKGVRGGRDEADVVGFKASGISEKRAILEIYHVEIGQLPGFDDSVEMLRKKFSRTRTDTIEQRFKQRLGFTGGIQYKKLYIDIWKRPGIVSKLVKDPDVSVAKIDVWTPSKLYEQVFETMREYWKSTGESTLPEAYWMLKLIESMWESDIRMPND